MSGSTSCQLSSELAAWSTWTKGAHFNVSRSRRPPSHVHSSLDDIYRKSGPIGVDVVGKIAFAIVSGLNYLYDAHRIIHRGAFCPTTCLGGSNLIADVKPSNVLVNSLGHIKICDFGVSGELINSVADTFVGSVLYPRSPGIERDLVRSQHLYVGAQDDWSC